MNEDSKYYNLDIILSNKIYINFSTILYLILHVSIIIIFEILFYFLYIIKKEYEVFDYLIYDITHNKYSNLNDTMKHMISDLLKNATTINYINYRATKDKNDRMITKNELFIKSLIIIIFFIMFSFIIIVFGIYKKKIKLKNLLLNLFSILCMISIFEYCFFTNIISYIKPISLYELLNNIIINLQKNYVDN